MKKELFETICSSIRSVPIDKWELVMRYLVHPALNKGIQISETGSLVIKNHKHSLTWVQQRKIASIYSEMEQEIGTRDAQRICDEA